MARLTALFNRYSTLKQISLFSRLHWFQIQTIAFKSQIHEYKKGEVIIRQGTPPDGFYCLVSGRIQSYTENVQGKKIDVDFIRRGTPFGMTALLSSEMHAHQFVALNDSVVLKIDKDDFQEIVQSISQLGVELSQSLSRQIRQKVYQKKTVFESSIIGVYCPVKGTGSSTYALHLALSLQKETFKKVILVHFGPSDTTEEAKPLPKAVSAGPRWKSSGIGMNEIVDDYEKIMANVVRQEMTIDYFHADFDPRDKTLVDQISPFVTAFVDEYHYVVLDLPNEMDEIVRKTLSQCDLIHLYCLGRQDDLRLARQVINHLEEELKEYFNPEKIQVIIRKSQDDPDVSMEDVKRELDYEIYRKLPSIQPADVRETIETRDLMYPRLSPDNEYVQTIRGVARQISNVLVGLVLGGGAALGLAHIGVLRVIEEEKIPIDIVVGSSMGALIGGLWVAGKDSFEIEKIAREFESRRGLLKLMDPVVPVSGFIGGQAIRRWLKKHLGGLTFYNTRLPLLVVAYDLIKRQELVINSGSLVDAISRSVAIPGVMNPVMENEKMIIDGGVLNPLPTNVLKSLGIRKIIAVNVLQSPDDVAKGYDAQQERLHQTEKIPFWKSPKDFLLFRLGKIMSRVADRSISNIIVSSLQATEYVIAEQSSKLADVAIHPDLVGMNWFELFRIDEFIKQGTHAAREQLPQIKRLVEQ